MSSLLFVGFIVLAVFLAIVRSLRGRRKLDQTYLAEGQTGTSSDRSHIGSGDIDKDASLSEGRSDLLVQSSGTAETGIDSETAKVRNAPAHSQPDVIPGPSSAAAYTSSLAAEALFVDKGTVEEYTVDTESQVAPEPESDITGPEAVGETGLNAETAVTGQAPLFQERVRSRGPESIDGDMVPVTMSRRGVDKSIPPVLRSSRAGVMEQPISQEELFLPLLIFIADHGGEIDRARDDVLDALADRLGLSIAERERTTENGREQWRADVEFCRQKLIDYWDALQPTAQSGRGIWKLSSTGEQIVEKPPSDLLEKFSAWTRKRTRSLPSGAKKPPEHPTGYPDVRLAQIQESVECVRSAELRKKRLESLDRAKRERADEGGPRAHAAARGDRPKARPKSEHKEQAEEVAHTAPSGSEDEPTVEPSSGQRPDKSSLGGGLDARDHKEKRIPADGSNETDTTTRAPREYRPVPRRPDEPGKGRAESEKIARSRQRPLPIEVRVIVQPGGFCRVSLLPRRGKGQAERVSIDGLGSPAKFTAWQHEWFEDVVSDSIGDLLRQGIEWRLLHGGERRGRWVLSGRDVYVLGKHATLSGFVTTPRLIIGEDHLVLCSLERLDDVKTAIAHTGSPNPTQLDDKRGAPANWVVLRGVVPAKSVHQSQDADILNALRPLAEADIAFEGGIAIRRRTWLAGYPPRIRLRGDASAASSVRIDGQETTLGSDGCYEAPGWDAVGQHSVWCESGSRSYAVSVGLENWEPWEAYPSMIENADAPQASPRSAICGTLVGACGPGHHGRTVLVPAGNTLLVGAIPGEIHTCQLRADLRARTAVGFPSFEPVWALPINPLCSDKRTGVLPLADLRPPQLPISVKKNSRRRRRGLRNSLTRWCKAILDASRKGLRAKSADAETIAQWEQYKHLARSLWKQMR